MIPRQTITALLMTALMTAIAVVVGGGAEAATTSARVTRWIDGDTVETTRGTVRVIGIDTPERGACGSAAATRHAQAIAPAGSRIQLRNPASVVDHDRYGRSLRYVLTPAGRDVGLAQTRDGAHARYDSTDGYQWHPRQARYHRADANHPGYRCTVPTPTPTLTPTPAPIDVRGHGPPIPVLLPSHQRRLWPVLPRCRPGVRLVHRRRP